MKYKITEQRYAIGWKETDSIGEPKSKIVEYDSLIALLKGEEFYDEEDDDYDETLPDAEYLRMAKAIEKDGEIWTDDHYKSYDSDPEPCDSYLTYGRRFTFTQLSDADIAKMEREKESKKNAAKAKEKAKWDAFFAKNIDLSRGEMLDILSSNYKFPSEI